MKSSSSLQLGTSVSALMMEAYRDPARCSYPLHPFLSINEHCAPTSVFKFISYKLEIFSDGYASPKFIPHKIFLNEIYVNEKGASYSINNYHVHYLLPATHGTGPVPVLVLGTRECHGMHM